MNLSTLTILELMRHNHIEARCLNANHENIVPAPLYAESLAYARIFDLVTINTM